jgi:hypothetical protein
MGSCLMYKIAKDLLLQKGKEMNDTKTENRLSQILAEIARLQESLDENYDKFARIIQEAFAEGKRIEISGSGSVNGRIWRWGNVYVYVNTRLAIEKNLVIFSDDKKNRYQMKICDITKVSIVEMEDGISGKRYEATKRSYEASQNGGDRNTTGRRL